jgi:hypothetical protein
MKLKRLVAFLAIRSFPGMLIFCLCLAIVALDSKVAFGMMELAYDDGIPETTSSLDIGMSLAVKFSLPSNMPRARLLAIRVYKAGRNETDMRIHVLGDNGAVNLTSPFVFHLVSESKWNDANLTAHNIIVSDDFYVAIEYLSYYDPLIGRDITNSNGRSYHGRPGSWSPIPGGGNVMIRVIADHASATSLKTSRTPRSLYVLISESHILPMILVALVFVAILAVKLRDMAAGRKAHRKKEVL